MLNEDLKIKQLNIQLRRSDNSIRTIPVMEHDEIRLTYKKSSQRISIHGEVIKIGVNENRNYVTVIDYDFLSEENIHTVYVDQIIDIENNIHSASQTRSIGYVYCGDETVILFRANQGVLEYSADGETWLLANSTGDGGGAVSLQAVKEQIQKAIDELNAADDSRHLTKSQIQELINTAINNITHPVSEEMINQKIASAIQPLPSRTYVDQKVNDLQRTMISRVEMDNYIQGAINDNNEVVDQKIQDALGNIEHPVSEEMINQKIAAAIQPLPSRTYVDQKDAELRAQIVPRTEIDSFVNGAILEHDSIIDEKISQAVSEITHPESGLNQAQVQGLIDAAVEPLASKQYVDQQIDQATSNKADREFVEQKVNEAISGIVHPESGMNQEQVQELIDNSANSTKSYVDNKITDLDTSLQSRITDSYDACIANTQSTVSNLEESINSSIETTKNKLQLSIDGLDTKIDTVDQAIQNGIAVEREQTQNNLNEIRNDLGTKATKEELNAAKEELRTYVDEQIAALSSDIGASIVAFLANYGFGGSKDDLGNALVEVLSAKDNYFSLQKDVDMD